MVFTHLSARVPGPDEHFLLNPYGFLFSEVTASNLVKIDGEGNVLLNSTDKVNSAGFTIHSAVHLSRPDAHAVMHVHTDAGVAVSSTKAGFLPLNQHAMFVYNDMAYHDWEGVALDLGERERLVRRSWSTSSNDAQKPWHVSIRRVRSKLFYAALLYGARMPDSGQGSSLWCLKYA